MIGDSAIEFQSPFARIESGGLPGMKMGKSQRVRRFIAAALLDRYHLARSSSKAALDFHISTGWCRMFDHFHGDLEVERLSWARSHALGASDPGWTPKPPLQPELELVGSLGQFEGEILLIEDLEGFSTVETKLDEGVGMVCVRTIEIDPCPPRARLRRLGEQGTYGLLVRTARENRHKHQPEQSDLRL